MIGERVQELRKEREMSERELAKKADVSQGYISQIEHNSIVPSMNVLLKIASALGVPFASLAAEDENSPEVTVITKENRTKIKFADVNTEYEFLTPFGRDRDKATQIEMIHYTLKPRSWGSSNVMIHPESAECSVVLAGTLEYHIGSD
ncbi:MAG: XRE family transcriptional regulator, partial [Clostridia bacterium]|nr:XRE family transcriptional regulator [Clostridia bacterium]